MIQTAVFRAIADFRSLVAQSTVASKAMAGMQATAVGVGTAATVAATKAGAAGTAIGRGLAKAAPQMEKTGKSLSRNVSLPLLAIGGIAVKSFADFEKSLTQAAGKAGATGAEMEKMRKLALKMGAETSFSAGEAAKAMDEMAAGGLNARNTMKALPGVMLAAQAAGEDLAFTGELVVKTLNAFNLRADKAGHVADVMAQAANTSAASMRDLADGLAHAGQLGASANQDMETVVASISRLVDLGVPAASAGAAVRQMMDSLASPASNKARGLMEDLGITVRNANGEIKPMTELLGEVQAAFDLQEPYIIKNNKAVAASRAEFKSWGLNVLFGVEGMKAYNLLVSEGKPLIIDINKEQGKYNQLIKGMSVDIPRKSAEAWIKSRIENGKFTATGKDAVRALAAMNKASDGTAKKFAKLQQQTLAQKIDNMIGSFETLAITMVGVVAPGLKKIADRMAEVVGQIATWADENPKLAKFAVFIALGLAALGPFLFVFSKVIKVVHGFIIGMRAAGLAAATAGAKAKGASVGFAVLGRTIALMAVGMKAAGVAAFAMGKKIVQALFLSKAALISTGIGILLIAIGTAAYLIYENWDKVKAWLVAAWEAVAGKLKEVWAAVTSAFKQAWNVIATAARAVWNGYLKPVFDAIWEGIKLLGTIIFTLLVFPWVLAFKALRSAFMPIWDGLLKPFFLWIWGRLKAFGKFWFNTWKAVWEVAKTIWNAIRDFFVAVWEKIAGFFSKAWNVYKRAWLAYWSIVTKIAKKVWNAIFGFFRWVWGKISGFFKKAWGLLRGVWDKHWSAIKKVASGAWLGIKILLSNVWKRQIKPVFDAFGRVLGWLGKAFGKARDAIAKAWRKVANIVREPINWVIRTVWDGGIRKTFNTIADTVGLSKAIRLPKGPQLPRFAEGGKIRGRRGRDRQPIMATVGEFMQPTESVRYYGTGFMEAVRQRKLPRFFQGGFLGEVPGGVRLPSGPSIYGAKNELPEEGFGGRPWKSAIGWARGQIGGIANWLGMCAAFVSRAIGIHGGFYDAKAAARGSGPLHRSANIPAGAPLFWGGGAHGHTAISTGGGNMVSTDVFRYADAGEGPIARVASKWNMPFLGWSDNWGGSRVSLGPTGATAGGVFGFIANLWKKVKTVGAWIKDKANATADFIANPKEVLRKFIGDKVEDLLPGAPGSGGMLQVAKAFPRTMVDWIVDGAKKLVAKIPESVRNNLIPGAGGGGSPGANMALARSMMSMFGFGNEQWPFLQELWQRESSWNHKARNPSSGAYGIPQSLPPSKMKRFGNIHSPSTQIRWGLSYIKSRYGSPWAALAFHNRHNWYRKGGSIRKYDRGGVLPHGGFGFNSSGADERVLDPKQTQQWDALNRFASQAFTPGSPLALAVSGGGRNYTGNRADNRQVIFQTTVNNPKAETASKSLLKRVESVAQFGILDRSPSEG